ncbi:MAG: amidase family protein [Alphaproteobacteria bacterium]|jgi:aspartyl-tRNA(Asn)/glutamyl-tRNA(Gln) amidotransferase subunit A|nr:amidase family protein [Alphaproteobacteria bacterium]
MTQDWHQRTGCELGAAIGRGEIDPAALVDHFLARIESQDPGHEIYVRATPDRARVEAAAARDRAQAGARRSALDGVPISWKDLYDSAGVATEMGSPLLKGRVPDRDAEVLARATNAGLVCLGKTNTVQFALGGIGTNGYTGTPANGAARDVPRAPGGSSSGAAVSTAVGLAVAGIGSDTGGSVRIPAAWNGLVGLKTSFGALPTAGVLPLAPTLDTVGPLTRCVADAALLFAIMAACKPADLAGATLEGCVFLACETLVWDQGDDAVASAVRAAIDRISNAGARIDWAPVPEFAEIDAVLNSNGAGVVAEGYVTWKDLIDNHPDRIDTPVIDRFHQGRDMSASALETVNKAGRELSAALHGRMAPYTAILAPTVPIVPPPIAEVTASLEDYRAANGKALRNTRLGNVLPCCALTLPCPDGPMPAGLMMMALPGHDQALLRAGAAVEAALA